MDRFETEDCRLAREISAMSENEVCHFIRNEQRNGRLSQAVRALNSDVLSGDFERRRRGEAAIRKLGFI